MAMKTIVVSLVAVVCASCTTAYSVDVTNLRSEPVSAWYLAEDLAGGGMTSKSIKIGVGETKRYPVVHGRTWGIDMPIIQIAASHYRTHGALMLHGGSEGGFTRSYRFPEEFEESLDSWTDRYYFGRLWHRTAGQLELLENGGAVLTYKGATYPLESTKY